ncbi:hypothetical protein [Bradyrhizobium pachyrhizi]|uniref:hypothetical protein n=1 Tax=Bradyrhizobium pachyrhizi TaxID=280333 RepID=UPI00128EF3C3|nr:hypothetical protein [Bradyrhizobium pachyrhizi]
MSLGAVTTILPMIAGGTPSSFAIFAMETVASVAAKNGIRLRDSHSIDIAKAEKALFQNIWDDRAGLYFVWPQGSVVKAGIENSFFAPLSDDHKLGGARVSLLGFELDIVFDTAGAEPAPWTGLIHRPGELMFSSDKRTHHLLMSWPPGFPGPTINFDTRPPSNLGGPSGRKA